MSHKKNVRKAHNKNKQAKQLKRKKKIKQRKNKSFKAPKMDFEQFSLNYAVDNMAKVSFSYLEKGTNYYLGNLGRSYPDNRRSWCRHYHANFRNYSGNGIYYCYGR